MRIRAAVLKAVAYAHLYNVVSEDLSKTEPADEQVLAEAAAALEIIRLVDAGQKRIVIDVDRPAER